MSNVLYIHIGLHKTATTSLQKNYYPHLTGIEFIGRNGGDVRTNNSLYQDIVGYCCGMKNIDLVLLEKKISHKLKSTSILLSDEWLTSDYDGFTFFSGSTWQSKLDNLLKVTKNISTKIILTLRNPIDCSFSLYCEYGFVGVRNKYPTYMNYVKESNEAKVFHYDTFLPMLHSKFDDILILNYNDLGTNFFLKLSKYLGQEQSDFVLHANNVSIKSERGVDSRQLTWYQGFLYTLLKYIPNTLKHLLKRSFLIQLKAFVFKKQ